MIDVHGHVFNAAYVPIPGVLLTRTRLSPQAAHAAAAVFNAIVQLDPPPRAVAMVDPLDFSEAEIDLETDLPIESDDEAAVGWVAERVPDDALDELGPLLDAANATFEAEGMTQPFGEEKFDGLGRRWDLIRFLRAFVRSAGGWGRWFILLLGRETVLVRKMYKYYPDVRHFVVHMMDMDNFYEGDSKLEFVSEQIPRLAALARASGGRILPFVAIDPTRTNAMEIVREACQEHGFKGVKFYPPSGYRPLNNTEKDVPPGVDPRLVEDNLSALYQFCESTGTPIFTHCQPKGMDARPGSGELSHPAGWEPVLKRHPKLRLCIGHAGGEPAWFGKDGDEDVDPVWRLKTVELCCTHEHVYCEVGHLDDLLDKAARKRFRDRLAEAAKTAGTFRFADKIMYGSDYHLLVRTPNFKRIPQFLDEIITSAGLDRDAFFDANAARYLGLSAG
jgi:predicted TIM-barrel fold metal-dependent hydrolase